MSNKILIDPYRTPPTKLTSTPYPVIYADGLAPNVDIIFGQIYGWLPLELTFALAVQSGELRQLLKTYDIPWEGLDLGMGIQSGELRQILKSYDVPWEGLGFGIDVQSGELKVILIQYTNWDEKDEEVELGMSLVSGTLA